MKVFLLRQNRTEAISAREEAQIKDLINLVYKVILEQQRLKTASHMYRKRTYTLQKATTYYIVAIPDHIMLEDLSSSLVKPLITHLQKIKEDYMRKDSQSIFVPTNIQNSTRDFSSGTDGLTESLKQVGAKVKVRWSQDEVSSSGWRAVWYTATVQGYCERSDTLTIVYSTEPGVPYDEELFPLER